MPFKMNCHKQLFPVYLVFISLLIFARRSYEAASESPLDIANIHKYVAIAAAGFFTLHYLSTRGLPRQIPSVHIAYGGYIICAALSSLLFSEWFAYSIIKTFEIFVVLVVSLYIVRLSQHTPLMGFLYYEACLNFFKILMFSVVVGIIVYPGEAIQSPVSEETVEAYGMSILPYQIRGAIFQINPNALGILSAIVLFVCLVRLKFERSTKILWMWTLFSSFVLIFAQSRTAFLGLCCAIAVTILFSRGFTLRWRLIIVALLTLIVLVMWMPIYAYLTRGVSEEQLAGLSGRALWWEIALSEFFKTDYLQQVFGLGYMVSARTILQSELGFAVGSLHSDYMDAFISTGYIGITFFVGTILLFGIMLVRLRRIHCCTPFIAELIGIGIILIVRTFTGSTVASQSLLLPLFLAMSVCMFLLLKNNTYHRANNLILN